MSYGVSACREMPHETIIREQYGSSGREFVYIKPPDQNTIVRLNPSPAQGVSGSIVNNFQRFCYSVFLPQGYPESVSDDYLYYQLWDTVQAFASSMSGILTTQAIMRGVGVGDQGATPVAAAITWIMKEGSGNMGRILFAWWKGTSLDVDCKKWRLCADILNDIAMFLELLLPHFLGFSTGLLCTATVLKSIVGVAGGATRSALTQHQAIRNNMADVSAKDGSQETCVNLLASVLGVLLLMSVEGGRFVWQLFGLFTVIHLYANYKAVSALTMSSLNPARLNLVLQAYLTTGHIPSPDVVNRNESVFLGMGLRDKELCGYYIKLGASLKTVVRERAMSAEQLKQLINMHRGYNYLLFPSEHHQTIFVFLTHTTEKNSNTALRAYFHAVLSGIASHIMQGNHNLPVIVEDKRDETLLQRLQNAVLQVCSKPAAQQKLPLDPLVATDLIISHELKTFLDGLRNAGWCDGAHHLGSNEWFVNWMS